MQAERGRSTERVDQHIFYVEGNIGSGKTSFLKALEEAYPDEVQVIYEPVHQWESVRDSTGKNILDYFYGDMARYSYLFQSAVFLSRVRALEQIDPKKPIVFVERSVDCDSRIFATNCVRDGTMSEIEWCVYRDWHEWMCAKLRASGAIPPRATYAYLRTTPELAFERMRRRNRPSETGGEADAGGVTLSYLQQLHKRHEAWLFRDQENNEGVDDGACAQSTVTLDGTLDFRDDARVLQRMFDACKRAS